MKRSVNHARMLATALALSSTCNAAIPLSAQDSVTSPSAALSYADTADLALAAPVVAEVRVRRASELSGRLAPGLAPGSRRYLVEADVTALIRGASLPPRISYLVDLAAEAGGKRPKLAKGAFIIFARTVPAKPATVQLTGRAAHQPATPELSARVRDILREAATAGAPPRIAGVGEAFHVSGAIEGEGETQIFLKAADGKPLSLSIWRKPGAAPRWAVSLGEIVDEGAEPPARDTLLWYRLACSLPQTLPPGSVSNLDATDAQMAAADYETVIAGLGPCRRGTESPAQNS